MIGGGGGGTTLLRFKQRRPTSQKRPTSSDLRGHSQRYRGLKKTRLSYLEVVAELAAPLADADHKNPRRHGIESAPVSNLDLEAGVGGGALGEDTIAGFVSLTSMVRLWLWTTHELCMLG